MPDFFNSSSGLKLNIPQVVEQIVGFMREKPDRKYMVTIGTDSELMPDKNASFVSAVVVHRVGNGGRYFWRRGTIGKFHTLRDRMIREVMISLEVAQELLRELEGSTKNVDWGFEVHVDVGEKGDTKAVIQEVVGMVRAYHLEPKIKPLSYAASNVADRHV